MSLPPFPVDGPTLDLLRDAINPDPETADRSSVEDLLTLYSQLGGSDTEAVAEVVNGVRIMRGPRYHVNDVLTALVEEIRRLRSHRDGVEKELRDAHLLIAAIVVQAGGILSVREHHLVEADAAHLSRITRWESIVDGLIWLRYDDGKDTQP